MRHPKFGKVPSGERLKRIQKSPNYKDGKFQNLTPTPMLAEGYSMAGEICKQMFKKFPRRKPVDIIPSVKTNLLQLNANNNALIWFGHSSYYMQINSKKFLIDPVFSGNASPVPGSVKAFKGTDVYTVADMPSIDYLIITHDHYDHLDYETIVALKDKVQTIICGLGVGEHFEFWGYASNKIIEKDWYEEVQLDNDMKLYSLPARHKSGRTLKQENTLWLAYLLETSTKKIFIGGDGGYDTHFASIGKQFGSIDFAIIENGQYNEAWHYIHLLPDETLQAAKDLHAKRLMPVHNSKFTLARHAWDEPMNTIASLNNNSIPLVTPMIGEVVYLDDDKQQFKQWWKGLQ